MAVAASAASELDTLRDELNTLRNVVSKRRDNSRANGPGISAWKNRVDELEEELQASQHALDEAMQDNANVIHELRVAQHALNVASGERAHLLDALEHERRARLKIETILSESTRKASLEGPTGHRRELLALRDQLEVAVSACEAAEEDARRRLDALSTQHDSVVAELRARHSADLDAQQRRSTAQLRAYQSEHQSALEQLQRQVDQELSESSADAAALRERIAAADARGEATRSQLDAAGARIRALEADLASSTSERVHVRASLDAAIARADAQTVRAAAAEEELREVKKRSESETASLRASLSSAQAACTATAARLADADAALSVARKRGEEADVMRTQLDTALRQLSSVTADAQTARSRELVASEELRTVRDQLAAQTAALTDVHRGTSDARTTIESLRAANATLERRVSELLADTATAREQVNLVTERHAMDLQALKRLHAQELTAARVTAGADLAAATAGHQTQLAELRQAHEGQISELREALQSARAAASLVEAQGSADSEGLRAALQEERSASQRELAALRQELRGATSERDTEAAARSVAQREITSMRAQLQAMEAARVDATSAAASGSERELSALRERHNAELSAARAAVVRAENAAAEAEDAMGEKLAQERSRHAEELAAARRSAESAREGLLTQVSGLKATIASLKSALLAAEKGSGDYAAVAAQPPAAARPSATTLPSEASPSAPSSGSPPGQPRRSFVGAEAVQRAVSSAVTAVSSRDQQHAARMGASTTYSPSRPHEYASPPAALQSSIAASASSSSAPATRRRAASAASTSASPEAADAHGGGRGRAPGFVPPVTPPRATHVSTSSRSLGGQTAGAGSGSTPNGAAFVESILSDIARADDRKRSNRTVQPESVRSSNGSSTQVIGSVVPGTHVGGLFSPNGDDGDSTSSSALSDDGGRHTRRRGPARRRPQAAGERSPPSLPRMSPELLRSSGDAQQQRTPGLLNESLQSADGTFLLSPSPVKGRTPGGQAAPSASSHTAIRSVSLVRRGSVSSGVAQPSALQPSTPTGSVDPRDELLSSPLVTPAPGSASAGRKSLSRTMPSPAPLAARLAQHAQLSATAAVTTAPAASSLSATAPTGALIYGSSSADAVAYPGAAVLSSSTTVLHHVMPAVRSGAATQHATPGRASILSDRSGSVTMGRGSPAMYGPGSAHSTPSRPGSLAAAYLTPSRLSQAGSTGGRSVGGSGGAAGGALAEQVARAALLLEACQTVASEADLRLLHQQHEQRSGGPLAPGSAAAGTLQRLIAGAQPKLERAHSAFARCEAAMRSDSDPVAGSGSPASERVTAAGALIVSAQAAQASVRALLSEASKLGLEMPISTSSQLPGLAATAAHIVSGGLAAAAMALQAGGQPV